MDNDIKETQGTSSNPNTLNIKCSLYNYNKMGFRVTYKCITSICRDVMRPVLIVFALFIFSGISHAGQNVVIYPVYHNDTDRVIQEILDGLHDQLGGVTEIAVDTELDNNVIRNRVASLADEDVVIALTGDMGVFARSSGF